MKIRMCLFFIILVLSSCALVGTKEFSGHRFVIFMDGKGQAQVVLQLTDARALAENEWLEIRQEGTTKLRIDSRSPYRSMEYSGVFPTAGLEGVELELNYLLDGMQSTLFFWLPAKTPWAIRPNQEFYDDNDRLNLIWTDYLQSSIILNYNSTCFVDESQNEVYTHRYRSPNVERAALGAYKTRPLGKMVANQTTGEVFDLFQSCIIEFQPDIGYTLEDDLSSITLLVFQAYDQTTVLYQRAE